MRAPPVRAQSGERNTRHRQGLGSGPAFGGNMIPPVELPEAERSMSMAPLTPHKYLRQPRGWPDHATALCILALPKSVIWSHSQGGRQHRGLRSSRESSLHLLILAERAVAW